MKRAMTGGFRPSDLKVEESKGTIQPAPVTGIWRVVGRFTTELSNNLEPLHPKVGQMPLPHRMKGYG